MHTAESHAGVFAHGGPKGTAHELRSVRAGSFGTNLVLEAVATGTALIMTLAILGAELFTGTLAVLGTERFFGELTDVVRLVALDATPLASVAVF